jgi:hypothetical protein
VSKGKAPPGAAQAVDGDPGAAGEVAGAAGPGGYEVVTVGVDGAATDTATLASLPYDAIRVCAGLLEQLTRGEGVAQGTRVVDVVCILSPNALRLIIL